MARWVQARSNLCEGRGEDGALTQRRKSHEIGLRRLSKAVSMHLHPSDGPVASSLNTRALATNVRKPRRRATFKTEQALAPGASPEMNVPGEPRTEREWIFPAWTCCCLP
jgi:hypothetical protein